MKFKIAQHQEMLRNSKLWLDVEKIRLDNMQAGYDRAVSYYSFYEQQIKTAIDKGMDSFDSERFMKKKPKGA
jgi:hypothetical protein